MTILSTARPSAWRSLNPDGPSLAITNTYTHLLPALQRETADAWDRIAAGLISR